MAWTTPKTDWGEDDQCTYVDMNRIMGNVLFLYPGAAVSASYSDSRSYVTAADVTNLYNACTVIKAMTLVTDEVMELNGTASAFNAVESFLESACDRMNLILKQAPATVYLGDDLFLSAVPENYVRGL